MKPITSELRLSGPLIVEDQERLRVMVGRVHVTQIAALYERYGDLLLQRNIRRYLGLKANRVNRAIYDTLRPEKADKFYFYNNGLTIVCDMLDYNSWQEKDHIVRLTNMQVINGGQTCRTIYEALKENGAGAVPNASVMVRIYQVPAGMDEFVQDITYSTNSQNSVDLRDLHFNDTLQKDLEIGLAGLGWQYKRQRDDRPVSGQILTSAAVAEAVLSVWREQPQHARFLRRELFGRLYDTIFSGLTAAQALVATLIFRDVEARRRSGKALPTFVPYASQYLSMLVGRQLLGDTCQSVERLTHRNVQEVLKQFEAAKDDYYRKATEQITAMLRKEYPDKELSLHQLSAVFRRGELLGMLG